MFDVQFLNHQIIRSLNSSLSFSQLTTHNPPLTTFFLCLLSFFVAIFFLFFPAVITHFHLRKSAKSADKKSVLIRHIRPPAADPRAINLPFFCDSTFAQNRSFMMDFDRKPLKIDRSAKMFFLVLPQIATNRRILGVFRQKLTKGGNPAFNTN